MHLTCDNEWPDVSNLLIDHDSDMNSKGDHGLIPLHTASANGHLVIIRLSLDSDRGSDVNLREAKRCTSLYYVSKYGHLEVAQLLIERGVNVNSHARNGSTALHNASGNGHLDIAKLLIDLVANIDSRNNKQETPLDLTSRWGHLEIARF